MNAYGVASIRLFGLDIKLKIFMRKVKSLLTQTTPSKSAVPHSLVHRSALALWKPGAKWARFGFSMRNAAGRPQALGLMECYICYRRSLAYRLLTAGSKILKAKSWAPGKVCALLHMGNNKKYVSFDFHAFILCTAQGQEDQGGVGEKGYVMPDSLPVHELLSQGCAIGQGMAFNLPGLNRVSDLVRVCPNYKQGITRLHIQVRVNSQTKGLERGWKRGARLERDAKKPLTRACEILKPRYADFEKKSQLFCSC